MAWLMIYGSVSVAVLAVLTIWCARSLRGDVLRFLAIAAAAALWPVLAIGLLQYGAVQLYASYLGRCSTATPPPVAVDAEPATVPMDLVDSLARFAQQIGGTRHA